MLVDVYHHSHWDTKKWENITIPAFATEARIKQINGELVPGTKRQIDPRLLDSDGSAIIQAGSEDWKLLTELAALAGQRATITGNKSRKHLDQLDRNGLITSRSLNVSTTEHVVSDLGRLALAKLYE